MHRTLSWLTIFIVAAVILAGCANSPARKLLDPLTPTSQPAAAPTNAPATTAPPTDVPATTVPATDVPATATSVPPTAAPATKVPPSPTVAAANSAIEGALKDVIQKANDQQVEAFTKHDPTAMKSTATSGYYAKLLQINQDLESGGVAAIKLVKLEWGPITVKSPTSAEATTIETWQTSFNDGTTDESADRNIYSLVVENGAWHIADDVHPDSAGANPAPGAVDPNTDPTAPSAAIGPGQSRNWSGYAATGGKFTSVTGTWTVPKPTASSVQTTAATWVGIGGTRTHDLIQAGTEETTSTGGQVRYNAWVELLPASSQRVPLRVAAGDSVTVSITQQTTGTWLINMVDNTTGQKYETTKQYNSSLSSAEWVEEAPSGGRRVLPLENFGTVHVTAGSAVKDGKKSSLTQLGAKSISMIDGSGHVIATPSAIASDGGSFDVTRTGAQSPTLPRF